ncbi:hypothetical protein HD553DRAFT_266285 [Filobasidium floriforme]|uniref:uncharacterized protein n=1 Tax=Filobasidium floriforme TaxID=5210 RepID=UPI001E8D726F|nr:uncharacterized protein HD553DRAFT_266285 [Filobasidium floriforme]KAH8090718.1 hypothetical protein HD553DRAFT_266285 [Filobasidium floriforme]
MSERQAISEQIHLIEASLLPAEQLILTSDETPTSKLTFEILSKDSTYSIHVLEQDHSDAKETTLNKFRFQIRSTEMNREEALGWQQWVEEVIRDHGDEAEQTGYPLSTMIIEHFLPLLQSLTTQPEPNVQPKPAREGQPPKRTTYRPGHVLFSSHHLLAPSKRKNLVALSSQLGLVGFGKVGYPGIIFAEGDVDDLEEFSREVKSWQWLALRLRVLEADEKASRSEWEGRKGKWEELNKVGEAVDYLKKIDKEHLLLDIGIGSGGHKA